ncbi:hypothetical protein ACFE04_021441 [Oxalis oulophora]
MDIIEDKADAHEIEDEIYTLAHHNKYICSEYEKECQLNQWFVLNSRLLWREAGNKLEWVNDLDTLDENIDSPLGLLRVEARYDSKFPLCRDQALEAYYHHQQPANSPATWSSNQIGHGTLSSNRPAGPKLGVKKRREILLVLET